jgi:hypothetical protein
VVGALLGGGGLPAPAAPDRERHQDGHAEDGRRHGQQRGPVPSLGAVPVEHVVDEVGRGD